jgi:hypothetical protein
MPPLSRPEIMGSPKDRTLALTWLAFLAYLLILGVALVNHELWGDELHSWNIVKASRHVTDLIRNTRYEGHPLLWYLLLWPISRLTHSLVYIRLLQFTIASAAAFLILFWSPLPRASRVLALFGYYFLFEYGVFCRNYAIGVLLVFSICVVRDRDFKGRTAVTYLLLFLLANVHLFACLLAMSMHLVFLFEAWQSSRTPRSRLLLNAVVGALWVAAPLGFMIPPADGQLNPSFWLDRWSLTQLSSAVGVPLRALAPIPAWWRYHFWNSHFLLDLQGGQGWLKGVAAAVSLSLVAAMVFVLRDNRRGAFLLLANLALTLLASFVLGLTSARYVGFVFIGFLAGCWLSSRDRPLAPRQVLVLNALLVLQIAGAAIAVGRDIRFPFSRSNKVIDLARTLPANARVISDYWCIDNLSAYLDRPFYSVQQGQEVSFLKWDTSLAKPKTYADGIRAYYSEMTGTGAVFMFSAVSPQDLDKREPDLDQAFDVRLFGKFDGAIERSSNVYLYQVSPKHP